MVGETPHVSTSAVRAVEAWEATEGAALPPAVREWFSLENGQALLRRYSNEDHPRPLEPPHSVYRVRFLERQYVPDLPTLAAIQDCDIGSLRTELEILERIDEPRYLRFLEENQGVCAWYVRLDDSSDPEVYNDGDDRFDVEGWATCGAFSAFLFDWICDYRHPNWHQHNGAQTVVAACRPPGASELEILRRAFQEGPGTPDEALGWRYRFYTSHGCVLIGTAQRDERVLPAPHWEVRADSEGALEALLRVVWPLAGFGEHARIVRLQDEPAERVLQRLGWVKDQNIRPADFHLREGTTLRLREIEEHDPALLHRAIDHLTRAIEADPELKEAYEQRLFAWERLGKQSETLPDLDRLIEFGGHFREYHLLNRSQLHAELGELEKAAADVCAAIQSKPDYRDYSSEAERFQAIGRSDLVRVIYECWRRHPPRYMTHHRQMEAYFSGGHGQTPE